ncbi:aspartyl-phosphate phosphatase Spo0E family protein [Mesobacillus subterraneus]|uniref:Aspartyl-phosphate phosphatase Spo0E family protein n=1 Tax=Mesobacillus subterraneus TaxID=285983 RepID=A0A3R9DQD4_9BACI|nr:aspartyl-phosphate phosphatase Spo0E family protein [Mesobacillus subterraneus]RSD24861.1 aspartyl-phosphate phosphatase Spo0E family protein [Mesobacillus subterraneus]
MSVKDLIEDTRRKMIISIRENGYTSKKTIQLSQELDMYIWEQQKIGMKLLKEKAAH